MAHTMFPTSPKKSKTGRIQSLVLTLLTHKVTDETRADLCCTRWYKSSTIRKCRIMTWEPSQRLPCSTSGGDSKIYAISLYGSNVPSEFTDLPKPLLKVSCLRSNSTLFSTSSCATLVLLFSWKCVNRMSACVDPLCIPFAEEDPSSVLWQHP